MTRVRFAPSPTGALHIGGIRTALYNYLFAKKHGGVFLLRIEDTDQTRFVPGAEEYIVEALRWCGIAPTEGLGFGNGAHAPYRQSDRMAIYADYAAQLLASGDAYYAFDTADDLTEKRKLAESQKQVFSYNSQTRGSMRNSLTLSAAETQALLDAKTPHVIRFKMPEGEGSVVFSDLIRGSVSFAYAQLDDKVLMKADGLPTYHLAHLVDDILMEISHVIRGDEWLNSTPLHVLLYKALGKSDKMPLFAHLPLILRPEGGGKLSKRDGDRLGIPVFPMDFEHPVTHERASGYKEGGYLPEAVVNFMALFGWSPGGDLEIMTLDEMAAAFDFEKINKAGAKFDIKKAQHINQQYIFTKEISGLAANVKPFLQEKTNSPLVNDTAYLEKMVALMRERTTVLTDFWTNGSYFFEDVNSYDMDTVRKKWKPENAEKFALLTANIAQISDFTAANIEAAVKDFMTESNLKMGDVMPMLRIALTGTMQGPMVFEVAELIGKTTTVSRLAKGFEAFGQ
jgi:glutamyl-tRNA synthetase